MMSQLENSYLQKWQNHAQEQFKDFRADFKQLDGISILDWQNKNGSNSYRMRVIFDEQRNSMFISGDLGSAVFEFTEKAILENIGHYNNIGYFMDRISCSSDDYCYDKEMARQELDCYLEDDNIPEKYKKELVEEIMYNYSSRNGVHLTDNAAYLLETYCYDYWDWIYDIGRAIAPRVIIWHTALRMATEQLKK